ncbi:unnamed protein product [Caenorhabditis angaria]|uniref:Uncharacterized protein n=1 Tax=Caenorhabditis angaria TaxID=860376 RepID=A0A9P1N9H7_9PELO|nr:unnamed protein product [Caenorhabditis angaria]
MRRAKSLAIQLDRVYNEQRTAATLASTATGFIMSICFFGLPLMWSGFFKVMQVPPTTICSNDPWSGITDL